MSYYRPCRKEFTPCQFKLIHDQMAGRPMVLNCNQDPYLALNACVAADIIISDPNTTWTSLTKQLCPGQRIIIKPTGTLTIDHCLITKVHQNSPNPACPNLIYDQLWDGIYIEGPSLLNGNPRLVISNNSTIEFSKNGIQALGGFSSVNIIESTFKNNLTQINLETNTPFNSFGSGFMYLTNSNFTVAPSDLSVVPLSTTQINVVARQLIINNSKIINPNPAGSGQMTGVRSSRSNLRILNGSSIENFHIGVDKAGDSGFTWSNRGLNIQRSSVKNCEYSILNTSQFVYSYGNWLEGDIVSEGLCYSRWLSNNIKADFITMHSPISSCRFEENLFENLNLEFHGVNDLSYSLCNTWKNVQSNTAFIGYNSETLLSLPESWGKIDTSSGNRHLDQDNPSMLAEDKLINYFIQANLSEQFTYDQFNSLLIGDEATNARSCAYDYPTAPPAPFNSTEVQYNFVKENNDWTSLNTLKTQKESALASATQSQIPRLLEDLSYIKFQMSDIVGSVLMNLGEPDSLIEATWLARAHPGIMEYTDLINKWYSKDFTGIENQIGSLNNTDAETLQSACNFVQNALGTTRNLGSLTNLELDTLSQIASTTFGDYSNIVRDYLRVEYNIDIPWPFERSIITPRESKNSGNDEEKPNKKNIFIIAENPSNGCFIVESINKTLQGISVKLFDLNGRQLISNFVHLGNMICFDGLEGGMYFLNISDPLLNISESHKLIIN